jgi:carbon-monoxide dehydrogenase small subunit
MKTEIQCTVNGKKVKLRAFPMARLLDVLREELKLTGTKEGCGEGECGACSVIIDGKLVNSCLVPLIQVAGKKIRTIEGIAGKKLHKMQEAFIKKGGAQCGICTPGMIMASVNLIEKKKKPKQSEIQHWLAGNLCRCTGFIPIFNSVKEAVK